MNRRYRSAMDGESTGSSLASWGEAAEAYARVPQHLFSGRHAWRMDLLREQRAVCLLRVGEFSTARKEFELILDRYEKLPTLAHQTGAPYVREAARRWPELWPRVDALENLAS